MNTTMGVILAVLGNHINPNTETHTKKNGLHAICVLQTFCNRIQLNSKNFLAQVTIFAITSRKAMHQ